MSIDFFVNEELLKKHYTRKTELLLTQRIEKRCKKIGFLHKFWNVKDINDVLGPYGCYIHQHNRSFAYLVKNELDDLDIDNANILAAAIPIDFEESGKRDNSVKFARTADIVEKCLQKDIPLFIVSQPGCTIYYIWCNKKNGVLTDLEYECPNHRRRESCYFPGERFSCIRNETGFCKLILENSYKEKVLHLLGKFSSIVKRTVYPVFELSAFLNYCIAEHHNLDIKIENNIDLINRHRHNTLTKKKLFSLISNLEEEKINIYLNLLKREGI